MSFREKTREDDGFICGMRNNTFNLLASALPSWLSNSIIIIVISVQSCFRCSLNMRPSHDWFFRALARHANVLHIAEVSHTEQLIHTFKTDALSLRYEKEHQDTHGETETSEEEVCAVAVRTDCLEHRGHCAGHDEVEQPLGSSRESHVVTTKTAGRDLGHVDPAHGAPAELEGSGE